MSSGEVNRWNNAGKIYVWRYPQSSGGWEGFHLTANREGCRFLLGLVERFRREEFGAHKKFALAEVAKEQMAVPNYKMRAQGMRRLDLKFSTEWEDEPFVQDETVDEVVFGFGGRLREALISLRLA